MTIAKPPVEDFATDFDHTDPQWVANPYPIWDELRQTCPVAHTNRYGGAWFPTTHELVSAVANDTEHFTSRTVVVGNGRPGEDALPAPIGVAPPITSDPPFHHIARRLILPAFSPGVVNNLEPQVRALCNKYLDIIGDKKEFNAGDEYAQFISPGVIKVMLGFPDEDEDKFREFVHIVLEGVDEPDVEKRMEQFQPVADYIEAQVADHRANPRDDLTTFLINAEIDGQKLPDEMIFGAMVLTLIAGIDTTWSAIASSLWHLATHPADRERLINEPELMPLAVEEFLRYYSPVTMARLVKEDFNFHGVDMKKDDWVLLGFPIANRDPKAFEDADKFIIDRKVNRHVAFGLGIHRCAGSNLARMELRIALEEFLKRYKNFELSDPKGVTWSQGQVRGARSLPFRILD